MTTALGIAPDSDGNGVTPLTHRRVQGYQWDSTGVCGGLEVSGTTSMSYDVSAGMAVTSRGDSDGVALAYYEGGSIETEAGDSSNDRYDVVWIKSNDLAQGDETNEVELGVTQGDPASSPSIPSIPTGAVAADTLLVPAGADTTNACESTGEISYAIPYGASVGLLGSNNNDTDNYANYGSIGLSTSKYVSFNAVTFSVPTDRNIEIIYDFRCKMAVDDFNTYGSIKVYYTLDGNTTDDCDATDCDEMTINHNWLRQQLRWYQTVEKGSHTVKVYVKISSENEAKCQWMKINRLYVYDRGVAE